MYSAQCRNINGNIQFTCRSFSQGSTTSPLSLRHVVYRRKKACRVVAYAFLDRGLRKEARFVGEYQLEEPLILST